jgi:capsular exopolysaccharide synthesis family protein
MSTPQDRTPSAPPFDLHQLLRMIGRRKWLLIVPWAVAALGGSAAAFMLQPIYFSAVTLLLERPARLSGPLGGMVGGGRAADQQAEVMKEQVQSSLFLRTVITASGVKSDSATRAWALREGVRDPQMSDEDVVEAFLVEYLRDAIKVRRQRGDVFLIVVGDVVPSRARRFAEAAANQFVISSKAAQLEAVRATQSFSVEQQEIYKRRLEESEARLEAARRMSLTSQVQGGPVNSNNLVRARSLADAVAFEIEDQRQRLETLRAAPGIRLREADLQALRTAETASLASQLASLERQLGLSELSASGGDAGLRVSIARKAIELEAAFGRAAAALPGVTPEVRDALVRVRLAQADLDAKVSRQHWLNGEIARYEASVVSSPDREMAIQRLEQEVENNRTLYLSFLQQSTSSQITEAYENASVSGRFSVLEPANLPRQPGKPNRPMLILLSILAGGVIGAGTVLVVEQHDQSMKNAEEIESLLGLPVLGAVPRVDDLKRPSRRGRPAAGGLPQPRDGLLQRLQVESPLGLEFRRIYLNLARARSRTLPRTLLVTSATRGEGKTTTTACLSITLARERREKMLLVDFDLRSPALHRALGLPSSSWGLAQMLNQRSFDERFVRSTVLQHLDFLPAGKSERPASELVDDAGVEWFLHEAVQRYPLVVIDSAPNLAVPDSLILGRNVEGVIYVIKAGSTVRKAAEYGVKVQREARDNLLGVLLNDSGEILPQYYGYRGNYYGYTSTEAMGGDA